MSTNSGTEPQTSCQVCGGRMEVILTDLSDMASQALCTQCLFRQVIEVVGTLPDDALATVTRTLLGTPEEA